MPNPNIIPRNSSPHNDKLLADVLIQPHQATKVLVGIYESTIPQPKLRIQLESSAPEQITITEICREEESGEYMLNLYFQSFGDRVCRAVVWER